MKTNKEMLINDFDKVTLKLASPDRVLEWSRGEVVKPETINYRTQRPEKNGLFDEKIFGPEKDFECYCGKYRGIRFKGIICEKCGVEITRSVVRRERMGHIDLATPVAHIWFHRGIPSRIALLLGISAAEVEKVVYFAGYIITKVNDESKGRLIKDLESEFKAKSKDVKDEKTKKKLKELATAAKKEIESIKEGIVLEEGDYHRFALKYSSCFEAKIGAEALYDIFKNLDLEVFRQELLSLLEKAGAADRVKLQKRISLVKQMQGAGVRPEWMFLTQLPVIPPALRPMVALEGGRHASSDINDLYRRVINRNNRLKKLKDIYAPDVILRNEKRILQEAVDALLDNSVRRGNTAYSVGGQRSRPLKSLADYLKGKQGYFRQNLLGKRVDYSGRSVIVVGPDLALDQCGLPKMMALELFRPFIISGLLEREIAYNIRGAGRLIEEGIPEVWAILEEVISNKYVLLNRAPTLHRQSMQGFRPVLIEGSAIQLHPLVCEAFNADFDGDQMAVHVPLSDEAQHEARTIMSANNNILKPGSGDVTTNARQDMILGIYWMTKIVEGANGEGKIFETTNRAISSYDYGVVDFRAKIKVLPSDSPKYAAYNGELFETTVGRLLFNSVLPTDFPYIDETVDRRRMNKLVDDLIARYGLSGMPKILDKIKVFGFKYATLSGITWGLSDLKTPPEKETIIEKSTQTILELRAQFNEGLLSEGERRRMAIESWQKAKTEIEDSVMEAVDPHGSVSDMITSGARGSVGQLTQMTGMKGLIQNPNGDIIETPVIASYKEGMKPIEYFITTHGSRKGLADTALKTAQAGYLTRRLFDVAQDIVVNENNCGTKDGVEVSRVNALGMEISLGRATKGRTLAESIMDGNKELFKKGHLISALDAEELANSTVQKVIVRSPMTCKTQRGVCQQCYGYDLTTNELVDIGEAVGTVAAQSLGEPSTQLTMNTKHAGGAASVGGDITQGLPRVEEVFDRRSPKSPAIIARIDGVVSDLIKEGDDTIITLIPDGTSKNSRKRDIEYKVPSVRTILVKKGQPVTKGQFMTDGSAELDDLYQYAGKELVQEYIISEINKIYELQGVAVSRKHLEVVIKQMFSRRKIKNAGDTKFSVGQVVEDVELERENERIKNAGGDIATADQLVTGITETALTRDSFLSAASFQNTTRKLSEAAVRGAEDKLEGLKENVIVGRLVPAGTGFAGSAKNTAMNDLQSELSENERKRED
ncbi:MAG: DNA-directed RNA polymerase subunit beta' [Parcubacteria group bacterium]|nr:DNA-directed RNA polymerase subunit beta' [Parcubacteria group bacterium]|tara:strand:- start:17683 stop:21348 length:3666 start_codon:yes stop_codon:yes gene_type:complete